MRLAASIVGLGVVIACSSSSTTPTSASALPFTPSNINLDGIDLTKLADEDVSASCEIRSAEGDTQTCFASPGDKTVVQSDGSKIRVLVVKSLRIEPTAHIRIHGGLPLAIVSLGDFNVLGAIEAQGKLDEPGPGGFRAVAAQKGTGPCGGPAMTAVTSTAGAGAGGGSSCGVGGQGSLEDNTTGTPGAKTPACGKPELVPLVGGSSGGGGDLGGGAGGGALELVSGTTFNMSSTGSINVGGGGGIYGGLATGQDAGGGGAGGNVLVEAVTIKFAGTIAANGGGGGGKGGSAAKEGADGTADSTPAPGGPTQPGGSGGAGTTLDGTNASPGGAGGGGGVGRVRFNSKGGQVDLSGGKISPATTTSCVSQGTVK
jgi:hypothetical protein